MTHNRPRIGSTEWAQITAYWRSSLRDLTDVTVAMHQASLATPGLVDFDVDPTSRVQAAIDAIEADLLARIALHGCRADSGCCPVHGEDALVVDADWRTTCKGGCGRVWTFDITSRPCGHPHVGAGRCQAHQPAATKATR